LSQYEDLKFEPTKPLSEDEYKALKNKQKKYHRVQCEMFGRDLLEGQITKFKLLYKQMESKDFIRCFHNV